MKLNVLLSLLVALSPMISQAALDPPPNCEERVNTRSAPVVAEDIQAFQQISYTKTYVVTFYVDPSGQLHFLLKTARKGESAFTAKFDIPLLSSYEVPEKVPTKDWKYGQIARPYCFNERGVSTSLDGYECYEIFAQLKTDSRVAKYRLYVAGTNAYYNGEAHASSIRFYFDKAPTFFEVQ
jgi:hypothetical protein